MSMLIPIVMTAMIRAKDCLLPLSMLKNWVAVLLAHQPTLMVHILYMFRLVIGGSLG